MARSSRPVRGTYDLLPDEAEKLNLFLGRARAVLERSGFREIATPLIEEASLFDRSSGAASDIVSKEMYRVESAAAGSGGRALVLRPEGTAPVVRAYLDNFHHDASATRLYYWGPMFRYNRPQKGRYRQFLQLGAEIFGAPAAWTDAECLMLLMEVVAAAGVRGATPLVNTLGCRSCQDRYRGVMADFLGAESGALCADCRRRAELNPLRALDCKTPACRPVLDRAPAVGEKMCDECRGHFDEFLACCRLLGLAPRVDGRLVRGLDYYTRTVFEVTVGDDPAAVAAGGRYDELVAELGGRPTPALGFALGLERLLKAAPGALATPRGVRLAYLDEPGERRALEKALLLLSALRAEVDLPVTMPPRAGWKLGRQLEAAARDGCRFAVIIGTREIEAGEVVLRDLSAGSQERLPERALSARLQKPG